MDERKTIPVPASEMALAYARMMTPRHSRSERAPGEWSFGSPMAQPCDRPTMRVPA